MTFVLLRSLFMTHMAFLGPVPLPGPYFRRP